MANTEDDGPEASKKISLQSYQTALCIVPPPHLWSDINRLRSLYDQAYRKWPPHINLLYPFAPSDRLPTAARKIREGLSSLDHSFEEGIRIRTGSGGFFQTRQGNTVHLTLNNDEGERRLSNLRNSLLDIFGEEDPEERDYTPHLTVGQSKGGSTPLRDYLLGKVNLLSQIDWTVSDLVILVREKSLDGVVATAEMKVWDTIDLPGNDSSTSSNKLSARALQSAIDEANNSRSLKLDPMITYEFLPDHGQWLPISAQTGRGESSKKTEFVVSTYNVMKDNDQTPLDRREILTKTVLSEAALADVLILQEVCDEFLIDLLASADVRRRYPFVTHGPSGKNGAPPLPSLRNIVVLSRSSFSWSWLPFEARHKGAAILEMHHIGSHNIPGSASLVIAAVHLSSGLTDSVVENNVHDLHTIIDLFKTEYCGNPRVIAGDFNFKTSKASLQASTVRKEISSLTAETVVKVDDLVSDAGYLDAWTSNLLESGDNSVHLSANSNENDYGEGEQGATFDPLLNSLAAVSNRSDNRPQRYDRILVYKADAMKIAAFDFFGTPKSSKERISDIFRPPSDHWGIRAKVLLSSRESQTAEPAPDPVPPQLCPVPESLSSPDAIKQCMEQISMEPTEEDINKRKSIVAELQDILTSPTPKNEETNEANARLPLKVVNVGSYGLGTWSRNSDIDCLCIGPISSNVFFTFAVQRLLKAASTSSFRILRKVRASTGTMLELKSGSVRFDLHYCASTRIMERLEEVPFLSPRDAIFDMSYQSLMKLRSYLDQESLRQTIPDMDVFRQAFRALRAWAKAAGVFSAKFGFLGGIHITIMLSRLHKLLHDSVGRVTTPELVRTFFSHYADFDWANQMVDSRGIKSTYRRPRQREPMAIVTHYSPIVNVARAVTVPSLRAIVLELNRANALLSEPGQTWTNFLVGSEGNTHMTRPQNFLKSFTSFVKLNVQYWGPSLVGGYSLVGWLESQMFHLLNNIDKDLPDIHARVFPARFTALGSSTNSEDAREYQGYYLIGLERRDNNAVTTTTKDDRKKSLQKLKGVVEYFNGYLRGNTTYFNPTHAWIEASLVKQADLGDLEIDNQNWGSPEEADPSELLSDEEDDDESDDEEEDDIHALFNEEISSTKSTPAASSDNASKTALRKGKTSKLRPAADILNRLRWDPSIDFGDFVIGYEDRFLGTKEMALSRWKSEQTDEEFIPQHRIVYFKRKSDGKCVWDRATRVDEIFGSGVGKK